MARDVDTNGRDAAERPRSVGSLDEMLLDAKCTVPPPRPGLVRRSGLIDRARASERRLVGVTAPAGYGKSTLLAQWAEVEDRRVAWVSLDRFDDDPSALLSLLASAFVRGSAGGAKLVAAMRGPGSSALGRSAPRLASVFRTSAEPFVLMLDDVHELQSPACHDVLGVVLTGIPHGSQLVAASRSEQPHLPRMRSSDDALELLASDLALDPEGAAQIFSQAHVDITPELAVAVTQRTEGWPVGLHLAALIAKDNDGEALAISGDDRFVADYLYRESLVQLPDDLQRFLRRTALLDQLSGPLCDAVLDESGAQGRLRSLEAASLFLVSLDRRREWYRYHGLFREFLLGELRRVEPDVITKLHLRAADWYESNGSPALALEHLLNTPEQERCVQLATALTLPTWQAGQMSTLQRWMQALGDTAIESYPPLAVLAGWIAVYTGQIADVQRWAAIADAASFDAVPLDGTASFQSARAMFRAVVCAAGPDQMLSDASIALEAEPPWGEWRDTALCLSAEAHLLTGDVGLALAEFAEASSLAAVMSNADSFIDSKSELAVLSMERGHWSEAADHVRAALALIDETQMYDYPTSVLAFACAARLALHDGDPTEAKRQLSMAMRARPTCTVALPFLAVRARLQLAKAHWAIGDVAAARHLMREIHDVLSRRPLGVLADEVSEFSVVLTSGAVAMATGGPPLTPAELRLLPYLQTHLTTPEIAERLVVSRNTVRSEITSIYRKLGATSRSDAVYQATRIGLLGE